MLTEQQRRFCKNIALYEMSAHEAFIAAGYEIKQPRYIHERVITLLNNKAISDEIDRLRSKYLDLDAVRRDVILEHQKTRDFDVTEIFNCIPYTDEQGVKRYRLEVKPIADWSTQARQACIGFDSKTGLPLFRDKEAATKEISRIFGLYKDNTVVVEENFDDIYADALGKTNGVSDDNEMFIDTEEITREEMEALDSKIMTMADEEQAAVEKQEEQDKEIAANPSDANKIKLRSLLNK